MSVETLKQQVQNLTPEEWSEFFGWCGSTEHARRQAQPFVEKTKAQVMGEIWEASPNLKPDFGDSAEGAKPWKQPQGAHDAYPPLAFVTHGGFTWQNALTILNPHEPGNDGMHGTWVKIITSPEQEGGVMLDGEAIPDPADGIQPWLAGLELKSGDTVVFQGAVYQVLAEHISAEHWPPDQAHSLYEKA